MRVQDCILSPNAPCFLSFIVLFPEIKKNRDILYAVLNAAIEAKQGPNHSKWKHKHSVVSTLIQPALCVC